MFADGGGEGYDFDVRQDIPDLPFRAPALCRRCHLRRPVLVVGGRFRATTICVQSRKEIVNVGCRPICNLVRWFTRLSEPAGSDLLPYPRFACRPAQPVADFSYESLDIHRLPPSSLLDNVTRDYLSALKLWSSFFCFF